MLITTRHIAFLVATVVFVMVAEWQYFAMTRESEVIRHYHGLCNFGVGQPYVEFIHQLRTLNESGDTKTLTKALRKADEHSHEIYKVWLYNQQTAYRESVQDSLE